MDGQEEDANARGDRGQAAPGRSAGGAGQGGGRGGALHRGRRAELRDELLDGEVFHTVREAQVLIERWRRHFNTVRPHGALGYRPPAPEVFMPKPPLPPRRPGPNGSTPPPATVLH